MVRVILAVWIFLGSLAAALASASLISHVLTAYPANHFQTFGSIIPATSETQAQWLPYAPAGIGFAALASIAVAVYYWRSTKSRDVKSFAVTLAAAINYFLSLFCVTTLVIAYFLLPKVANGA